VPDFLRHHHYDHDLHLSATAASPKPVAPDASIPGAAGFFILEDWMKKKTLVMKFGGTSVGSAKAMREMAAIVRDLTGQWPGISVVVSAMSGVTDLLLGGAAAAVRGDVHAMQKAVDSIREKEQAAWSDATLAEEIWSPVSAYLDELSSLYHAISVLGEASPRAMDAIASLGERMCVHLAAGYLNLAGVKAVPVEATAFLVTDDVFQSATPHMDQTRERAVAVLGPILDRGAVPVITGFIGATVEGVTTTLGRGGSDFSAAIVGAAIDAGEVWIYTDVDGVMTADPRQVPDARSLPSLSYREIAELAYYGAKVVHPKTIRPCVERKIPIRIKNTFHPDHPGTVIVSNGEKTSGVVKAVTAIRDQTLVTVQGGGMMGVPGIAARTFGTVARLGVSITMITQASSEQSICFSVPSPSGKAVKHALDEEFRKEIERRDIDAIELLDACVIVTIVGAGMRNTPGVSGRIFGALGPAKVNVIAIAQGSSECSISLIVDRHDYEAAVRAIHAALIADWNNPS
jgi:bifunctional aspartokinase / homoserine dehydrogenase 1